MRKRLAVALFLAAMVSVAIGQARHFSADDMPKIVRVSDPQISPDGKTIAFAVGRANLKEDRWDTEINFVEVATKQVRAMTHERLGVGSPRWSPKGDWLAYLAQDADKKGQIFAMPLGGGDPLQLTHSKTGVSLLAWKPDGSALAYAAADEEPEKKDEAKFEDAFEVGNNGYLERSRAMPMHLWLVPIGGGEPKRLTSGAWSLPNHFLPAGPPSQLSFTPDGESLIFVRAESPLSGDTDSSRLEALNVATGAIRSLTGAKVGESNPVLSPDGMQIAYAFPRDGKRHNLGSVYVAPMAGGPGVDAAYALDRDITGAAWMPDGRSLLLVGPDGTSAAMWLQPVVGKATRLALGGLNPFAAMIGRNGAVAFTATQADRPAELFYMAKVGDAPVQLTHLQTVTDGLELGKLETLHWKSD